MMDHFPEMTGKAIYARNVKRLTLENVEITGSDDTEPVLQLGPAAVTAGQLLLFGLAVGAVSVVIALRRGVAALLVPLGIVWLLSLAAPASWMVLSKAHAAIHTHLVPMLWHFALVPVSCLALAVMTKEIVSLLFRRRPDLVASH